MNSLLIFMNAYRLGKADRQKIEIVQLKRLQKLVNFSRRHSPYLRDLYRDVPAHISNVAQLPITTKNELMSNFDSWVTDPKLSLVKLRAFLSQKETIGEKYLNNYYLCTTSGTTGEPAVIVHDKKSRTVYNAVGFFRSLMARLNLVDLLTKVKLAAVVATDGHYLGYSTLMNRVKNSKLKQKLQKVFSVLSPVDRLVTELNDFQPDILGGYPTAIYQLAKEQLLEKLNIHPYAITASGETLQPYMRETMEKAFGSVVINSYGASEVPGLTSECKFKKLHINSDWYILEIVDERNVLVTNLSNYVQPIIRYKMNDYVVFDPQPCECGSQHPVISVVGRDDEILGFVSAGGANIEILPLAIATAAEETEGVYQSQIVQNSPVQITVRIKTLDGNDDTEVKDRTKHNLEKFLATQGLSNVVVKVSDELPANNPNSGKFRSVIGYKPGMP
ncbi:MAG: phenylacetate--CoA ligase family protein [Chitinophagaceae bacterium]|nr:MAG: phenylacetate--CoA ligase family protein [Chitinophagaceae bacterium]